MFRLKSTLVAVTLAACADPVQAPKVLGPQSVVLLATPKIVSDFDAPQPDVTRFLEHYAPLVARAHETIVIFAVGNSEHVLTYKGPEHWNTPVEWARFTGPIQVSERTLNYQQIHGIVGAFRRAADSLGIRLKVYDQVDGGAEFVREYFKLNHHPECFPRDFDSFDIRAPLVADTVSYASAPNGIVAGTTCGRFLVDQVGHYARDLGLDGMFYGNQLGTRGRWQPDNGPGYSDAEADAIRSFLAYSREKLEGRGVIWFDSYNNAQVERDTWSFPPDGYRHFDYLMAAGFCVITFTERYLDNLRSKVGLRNQTRVLATLDYVDPWYDYDSMIDFPAASAALERIAIEYRHQIDGLFLFANDHNGQPVPRTLLEHFANRFFQAE